MKFTIDFEPDSPTEITFLVITLIHSFLKLASFLRVFQSYGFLIKMIVATFSDVANFMVFFFMFVLFFGLIEMTLKLNVDPSSSSPMYKWVPIAI